MEITGRQSQPRDKRHLIKANLGWLAHVTLLLFVNLLNGVIAGYSKMRPKPIRNLLHHVHWEDNDWPCAGEDNVFADLSRWMGFHLFLRGRTCRWLHWAEWLVRRILTSQWMRLLPPDSMWIDPEHAPVASLLPDILSPTNDEWKLRIYSLKLPNIGLTVTYQNKIK